MVAATRKKRRISVDILRRVMDCVHHGVTFLSIEYSIPQTVPCNPKKVYTYYPRRDLFSVEGLCEVNTCMHIHLVPYLPTHAGLGAG